MTVRLRRRYIKDIITHRSIHTSIATPTATPTSTKKKPNRAKLDNTSTHMEKATTMMLILTQATNTASLPTNMRKKKSTIMIILSLAVSDITTMIMEMSMITLKMKTSMEYFYIF